MLGLFISLKYPNRYYIPVLKQHYGCGRVFQWIIRGHRLKQTPKPGSVADVADYRQLDTWFQPSIW